VQCKLKEPVLLESSCGSWNRLLLGCNPAFILCAAFDTLPTAVNLQRWHIQCSAKCALCSSVQSRIGGLSCCFVSRLLYVPSQPGLELLGHRAVQAFPWPLYVITIYADFPGLRASDCPQSTIPLVTPYTGQI